MPKREAEPQLRELATVCRRLAAARERVEQLEQQRDALIRRFREDGVTGADLSACSGLSPGRVTQICRAP
jgi:hypothetical protein